MTNEKGILGCTKLVVKIKMLNWVIIQLNLTTSDSIPKESVPAGVGAVTTAPGTYGFAALFLLSGAMELAVWTQATLCAVVGWVGHTFLSPAKTGSVGIGFDSSLENSENSPHVLTCWSSPTLGLSFGAMSLNLISALNFARVLIFSICFSPTKSGSIGIDSDFYKIELGFFPKKGTTGI